jgi:poly(hydroxyalkanoate) depolymerase family esterase
MKRRSRASPWTQAFNRSLKALVRGSVRSASALTRQVIQAQVPKTVKPVLPVKAKARVPARSKPAVRAVPGAAKEWLSGTAVGPTGARRFRLYRPPGAASTERLPVLVMLQGCGQDAQGFADSTRMNALARREGFLVLYPEQDHFSNPQGCWNWYDTRNGRAQAELVLILLAIDQVCLLHRGDPTRVAVAGLSAGASMAALLAMRYPARIRAVVMHSGVGPCAAHSTATALAAMRGLRQPTPHAAGPVALPPLLAIQGGLDRVVAPNNAAAVVRVWTQASGARMGAPRAVQRGQRHPMTISTATCAGQTVATLVEIAALGHAWSGGSARLPNGDGRGADASRMVWAFVARALKGPLPLARGSGRA